MRELAEYEIVVLIKNEINILHKNLEFEFCPRSIYRNTNDILNYLKELKINLEED